MGKIRLERKTQRHTPIQESFPSSNSELPLNPPTLPSYLQLAAIPHEKWCRPCIDPECIVCVPPPSFLWLRRLTKACQLVASSALLSDLITCVHKHEYISIIRIINALNINSFDREISVCLHFALGFSYYELKQYTRARSHLSQCKLVASSAGDISVCYFYLGKVASASHSPRKAAKHYRKAALCFQESSLAEVFNMIQPSCSALHHQSSLEFCQVGCYPQALDELTLAIETAQTKEECFSAHYDRGKLYQVMANHIMALDDFELAGELAEERDDCVAAKRAYKAACCACIMLSYTKKALDFFERSLTCVSVECRRCFAGSEQRSRDLHWICGIIDHLPIYTAITHIPHTHINGLMCIQERIPSRFLAVLERYPVDCQEEEGARPSVYPIIVEEECFSETEPLNSKQLIPFVELLERPHQVLVHNGLPCHRLNRIRLLPDQIQQFPWYAERSPIASEVQSDTSVVS